MIADIKFDFTNDLFEFQFEDSADIELEDLFDETTLGQILPIYTGATTIIPTASNQVLPTEKKSVLEDITVTAVPTYETSNPSGGYTFTILS